MEDRIIPIEIRGINDNIYSGFWLRLGANLLDILILSPILLINYLDSYDKNIYLLTMVPYLLFSFWYNAYLPKRYGGTPGKLIAGLKIVKIDSSPIGWKESFLRYSVDFSFTIINNIIMIPLILLADNEIYKNLNWLDQREYLLGLENNSYNSIQILFNIWAWSELIVLLFNKRKRAMHDFIAGTVIIKSKYIEQIRSQMLERSEINTYI
jgi:uncharacterized RDD family membrane protein YckC